MALFEPLFHALNATGVRYVVVGGVAAVLQGHARLTVDVDLVVDLEPHAARAFMNALVGLGFVPRVPVDPLDFASPDIRESWRRDKGMQVFTMIDRANPMLVVDVFVSHPIDFNDLWSRADTVELPTATVRIASIPDLIAMKRLAGRPQDLIDIERLEAILKRRGGPSDG